MAWRCGDDILDLSHDEGADPMTTMTWTDLLTIHPRRMPLILLTYKPSFISDLIKWYDGEWSHVVWHHRPHLVATQNWTFRERPITDYMGHDMAVYEFERGWDGDNAKYKDAILDYVNRQIRRAPLYDVLGVLGHLVLHPTIHNQRRYYCTEAVWAVFQTAYGLEDRKMTPSQLGVWLEGHGWKCIGVRKAERVNG